MSQPRGARRRGSLSSGFHSRLEQNALLRDRVGHHLSTLEQAIDALRRELAQTREENRALSDERARLREEVARADLLREDQADSESRLRQNRSEREREAQVRHALERDRQRFEQRCVELEQALAAEQDDRQNLEAEVKYLQDQVAQLTEIVTLLMPEDEQR